MPKTNPVEEDKITTCGRCNKEIEMLPCCYCGGGVGFTEDRKINKTNEGLGEDLFDTVYQWGRVGVVVDETCPTFQRLLRSLLETSTKQARLEGENKVWEFLHKNLGIDLSYQKEIYLRNEALKSSLEEEGKV